MRILIYQQNPHNALIIFKEKEGMVTFKGKNMLPLLKIMNFKVNEKGHKNYTLKINYKAIPLVLGKQENGSSYSEGEEVRLLFPDCNTWESVCEELRRRIRKKALRYKFKFDDSKITDKMIKDHLTFDFPEMAQKINETELDLLGPFYSSEVAIKNDPKLIEVHQLREKIIGELFRGNKSATKLRKAVALLKG